MATLPAARDRGVDAASILYPVLLLPAAGAWALLIRGADRMDGATSMGLNGWAFLDGWVVMSAAMMLPALVVVRLAPGGVLVRGYATVLFATTYLAVWAVAGLWYYPLSIAAAALEQAHHAVSVIAGVMLCAGCAGYQFTALRWRCVTACRVCCVPITPLQDTGRQGVRCGLQCVASSWPAMSLLLLLGFMDVAGMAVVGAGLFLERATGRREVSLVAGAAVLGYGIAVATHPALAPALAPHPAMHPGLIS